MRNLPLSATVLAKHLGRSGAKTASVVLRAGPPWARRCLSGRWVQEHRPDLAALAMSADGRTDHGLALMSEVLGRHKVRPETTRRIAHAAVVLHDLALAERAVDGNHRSELSGLALQADLGPRDREARSVVAAEQGNIDEALRELRGVRGTRAGRLSARLVGEKEVLRTSLLVKELSQPPAHRDGCMPVKSVLHVVSSSLPEQQSGYTIRTQGIVSGQRDLGVTSQVVTRLGFPVDIGVIGASQKVTTQGVTYHRLLPRGGMPLPGSRRQSVAVAELTGLVERERPDVLHAHSKHENAQIALIVGHRLGIPVVYEARGFLEETWASSGGDPASDFYRWSRDAETRCMEHADAVVVLSEAMAQNIEARGVDRAKITVVPNAVPADFAAPGPSCDGGWAPEPEASRGIRGRLGIPSDCTVFGSVSTLNSYEGFGTVIDAMALLADPGCMLLIVGAGPASAGLRLAAQAAGVSDQVVFAGRVPHARVREYLEAMDVFVVPRRETPVTRLVPPIKPLEAMAVGLPVLASDLAPLVEIVRPGVFGEVAQAQRAASWAEQMAALRYDPDHRRGLGARAAEFVARERTWANAAERYADVYAAAVRR
ncbi:MAG: glycosyltransferase family 4 protein [Ornithinimicrobium sp.]